MKYIKLKLLVVLTLFFLKGMSKEYVHIRYVNLTTNDTIYPSPCFFYPCLIPLPASIGDSIELWVIAFDQMVAPIQYWYKLSDTTTVLNFQPSDTISGSHLLNLITMVVTENFYLLAANSYRNQYFHFVSPTGIDENIAEASIEVYPMPVNNKLFLKGYFNQPADVAISIYDISGRVFSINNEHANHGSFTFSKDIENLSDGLYFISITTPTYRKTKKFVKK